MIDVIFERKINKTSIKVVSGDITEEETEAIVNAANSYLRHGGGVALAIVKRGGSIIQRESDEIIKTQGALQAGKSVITSAGSLKTRYVIHTVGPMWGEGNEDEKLRYAISSALTLAKDYGIRSVSFPAVSCGVYGFPQEEGTLIITETVKKFIEENEDAFDEIHLIGLGEPVPDLFKEALENV